MRGTPERAQADDAVAGLIPARAGNTATERGQAREPSAHPRSRGEHRLTRLWVCWVLGSSPLARGTHSEGRRVRVVSGLIPAHAGNTLKSTHCMALTRAHPCSRGEHVLAETRGEGSYGSSPLARGTCHSVRPSRCSPRLIPARAGNTLSVLARTRLSTAHPRSRGEHFSWITKNRHRVGSSPLARGTCSAST